MFIMMIIGRAYLGGGRVQALKVDMEMQNFGETYLMGILFISPPRNGMRAIRK